MVPEKNTWLRWTGREGLIWVMGGQSERFASAALVTA